MAKQTPSIITLLPLLLLLAIFTKVEGANNNSVKLFVFGDAFVDTGNSLNRRSYEPPNGITFPGKPAGRFSDGRVLTDFVASFLKIKSPAPFALRNSSELQYGVNFAFGGAGIFDTFAVGEPNVTGQIDSFEKLIEQKVYTKSDLESSIALVNAGFDDYGTYQLTHPDLGNIAVFTASLIKQMSLNLRRIHSLGVGKIAVGLLHPIGCLPYKTGYSYSYQKCDETFNLISQNHSQKLLQTVQELNHEVGKSVFVTLDLYNSFLSTIATLQKKRAENSTLWNPLQPCCEPQLAAYTCGSVDANGVKHYSLCEKPELSFFWDHFNPSQNGWYEVYLNLQSSLRQLTEKNF